MNTEFCSILATLEGEPIYGTAPEKESAILLPAHKSVWHKLSAKEKLKEIPNNSDLGEITTSFIPTLVLFYHPNQRTKDNIFLSDIDGIKRFSQFGVKLENEVKYLYAICTDGIKDKCCAKFGLSVAKTFSKECEKDEFSLTLETSHIGGCRFAATAVCFPSGNSYGRIISEAVPEIKKSEENGLIISNIFRGNIFVSEIQCWIMRHSMEKFDYVPTPNQTQVIKDKDVFHVTITPDKKPKFKFDLYHREVEFQLFSGCSNIDSGRFINRTIYDFVPPHTILK